MESSLEPRTPDRLVTERAFPSTQDRQSSNQRDASVVVTERRTPGGRRVIGGRSGRPRTALAMHKASPHYSVTRPAPTDDRADGRDHDRSGQDGMLLGDRATNWCRFLTIRLSRLIERALRGLDKKCRG
jgi:hypothetical protein